VSTDYDEQWKVTVNEKVQSVISNIKPDQRVVVLPENVNKAITALPRGKAAGMDCIQYEHLITVKDFLSSVLANLFTHILRLGHIPDQLTLLPCTKGKTSVLTAQTITGRLA